MSSRPASAPIDGVVLVGFGGPEGPEDILPFLRNVTAGRDIPDSRLLEVSGHYRAMGGVSPINAQVRELRAALADHLAARGTPLPVLWGNRNWHPFLADTFAAAAKDGHRHLLALALSAYPSYSSCRQYREDMAAALADRDLVGSLAVTPVGPFAGLESFSAPFADGLAASVLELTQGGTSLDEIAVLFTTHSIPLALARTSGSPAEREHIGDDGGAYVARHNEVRMRIAARAAAQVGCPPEALKGTLTFQSRSGSPATPWLEPDISESVAQAARAGARAVVIVPIGFLSDHVEVYWDLDVVAKECARELGVTYRRVATPGSDPRFVAGLTDLIAERIAQPVTYACPAGCCRHPRAVKATLGAPDSASDWAEGEPSSRWDADALAASGIERRDVRC